MKPRLVALVPAGGESRRMGSNKLALPWGEGTILSHLVDQLTPSVERTIVLLGPRSHELVSTLPSNVEAVMLQEQTPDMRSTIERGIDCLSDETDDVGVLIMLADQPHVKASIVDHLARQFDEASGSILIPTFAGKRGHPIILPLRFLRELKELPVDRGLDALIRARLADQRLVPLTDAGILADLDTPSDYERYRPQ
jgi:molybdenum cofactor cytidylyltransferase